jgi:hypothetical protein
MKDFETITPQWITDRMQDFQIKNPRQLSITSGVRYESLTLALNGKRELSSEIKKTLYWYFRFLDAERQILAFNRG